MVMTAEEWTEELKFRFKEDRLYACLSLADICENAGVPLNVAINFEKTNDISLLDFIKLLSALDRQENVDCLIPNPRKRPSYYLKGYYSKPKSNEPFKWGDEE
jgi:hypothetical protein